MPEGLDIERKSLGLAVRTNDPMSNVSGDEQLFKSFLVKPVEPMTIASFEQEYSSTDEQGNPCIKTRTIKRNVPMLSSTMALGNLNTKEVTLARIFTEMARKCAWHGYFDLAINYYLKMVHLNITSQSYQSQLLRQILTETVSVSRKEESLAGTRDFNQEKGSNMGAWMEKLKGKVDNAQQGQTATSQPTNFGLR